MIKKILVIFLFSLILKASTEKKTIETLISDIKKIKTSKDGATISHDNKAENERIKKRIISNLNLNEMTKKTLGAHYSNLKQADINRFKELFEKLMLQNLSGSAGASKDGENNLFDKYNVKVLPDIKKEKETVLVKSILSKKGEENTEIKYLFKSGKIIDLYIDDESLTANFLEQFSEVIEEDGFSGLIKLMEENIKEK